MKIMEPKYHCTYVCSPSVIFEYQLLRLYFFPEFFDVANALVFLRYDTGLSVCREIFTKTLK